MTPSFFIAGQPVFVDAVDMPIVSAHKWHLVQGHKTVYARTVIRGRRVRLHSLLIPGAHRIDHEDGNGLNNTRENLRPCTHQQNLWNAGKHAKASSRFKGVSKVSSRKHSFSAYINCDGKRTKLGRFHDEIAAALSYDIAAVKYFGSFARPNFSIIEAALVHPQSFALAVERCKAKGITA